MGETFHERLMRLGRAKDYAGALALLRSAAPEPTVDGLAAEAARRAQECREAANKHDDWSSAMPDEVRASFHEDAEFFEKVAAALAHRAVDAEEVARIRAAVEEGQNWTLGDHNADLRAILALLPAPGEVERLREAVNFAIEAIGTDAQERARQALRAALIKETRDAES